MSGRKWSHQSANSHWAVVAWKCFLYKVLFSYTQHGVWVNALWLIILYFLWGSTMSNALCPDSVFQMHWGDYLAKGAADASRIWKWWRCRKTSSKMAACPLLNNSKAYSNSSSSKQLRMKWSCLQRNLPTTHPLITARTLPGLETQTRRRSSRSLCQQGGKEPFKVISKTGCKKRGGPHQKH